MTKSWNLPLLTALALGAAAPAATAQNVPAAQKAIELERYNDARAALRGANTPEANFELGRLYQMRDLDDSAAFYFNRAAGATPFGQVAAGRAALVKGQTAQADAQFDAAAKATKNKDVKVLTMIVQAYAESDVKDISKGVAYANAAQTALKTTQDPELLVARGDLYLHDEKGGGEAMSSYDRATAANPNFARAYYKKGVLNVRSRNAPEAKANLEKAIGIEPNYAPAYKELAEMYYLAGQYDKALSTFQQFIGLAEKSTNTDAEYASFLFLTKKYPEALAEINKVLAKEPNNVTMNRLKAYSLYETGDYPGAAAAMDQYLKVAPTEKVIAEDYVYQARILNRAGRGKEAVEVIKKAIAQNPARAAELQNDYAAILQATGDNAGAIKVLSEIASKGDLADQFRLATALSKAKQYNKADSVFNIILTAKPTYAAGYLARARNLTGLDPDSKKGLAKPQYEKYIELSKAEGADPAKFKAGLVEANYYLGAYYAQQNNKVAAKPYFEQVLAIDPTNKEATEALSIVNAKPRPAAKAGGAAAKAAPKKK